MATHQRATPQERLSDAIRRDSAEQAARAVADGASLDHRYPGSKTALMLAVGEQRASIVKCLLTHGANPNLEIPWASNDGAFPIHVAVESGNLEITAMLIDAGAHLTVNGPYGDPLTMACYFGHLELLELLADRGAGAVRQKQLDSALAMGVSRMDKESADVLLERGANIDAVGYDGQTHLHHACHLKKWEVVEFLLSRGANPRFETESGATAIDFAESDLDDSGVDEGREANYERLKVKTIELVKRALRQAPATPAED